MREVQTEKKQKEKDEIMVEGPLNYCSYMVKVGQKRMNYGR